MTAPAPEAHANGANGVVGICSSHAQARAAADAASAQAPTGLAIYLGNADEPSFVHASGDIEALAAAVEDHADVAVHEVASRHVLRQRRTWDLESASPSLTRLYLIHAHPGLSADDFHRYWEREHAPRALRHHLGMTDYTQISVIRTRRGERINGITLTQWPHSEDLTERFTDGAVGDQVIHHDAAQFVDLDRLRRQAMQEVLLVEAPWPADGDVHVSDARSHLFDVAAEDVWGLVGRFDALLDWWPGGFVSCSAGSELHVGMTRTLTRTDGSVVVERLVDYRPEEHMLNLAIDVGMPETIQLYTCRYEVRSIDTRHCRLDWYPRAVVQAGAVGRFETVVDRGWSMVVDGLCRALGTA